MRRIEPTFDSAPPETGSARPAVPGDTFCTYLAKQFMAKEGFEIASVPEVGELAAPGDILLTYSDGYSFTILCMIDREAYPNEIYRATVLRFCGACGWVMRASLH